jgi:hypothetical protein
MTSEIHVAPDAVEELLEQAVTLSADYGEDVEAAVRAATEEPLDAARAERLYTRLLTILRRPGGKKLSKREQKKLAEEVAEEVKTIVQGVERPRPALTMVERHSLKPRRVVPVAFFNGQPVEMVEGFVDVETLAIWPENQRIQLHVAEFRERHGRDPDADELVAMMQGSLHLPSLGDSDPFHLLPLAQSIARKGVERPPIVTHDGVPKDGNRRIAASLLVLHSKDFSVEEKERARWIRVWQAHPDTTEDQFEAIVVSLNFEDDYKDDWPEYVKARLVVGRFDMLREDLKGRVGEAAIRLIKREVAKQFAISVSEVTRYIKMVRWAEDFEAYHINEANRDPAAVRYKSNDIFQWFYEIDAGRGEEKLSNKLDADDDLKPVVFDLMFRILNSGAQVRALHKVVADPDALNMLLKAHDISDSDENEALRLVKEAVEEGKRKSPTRQRIGFEPWLQSAVERLGSAAPDQWTHVNGELLREVRRVFVGAVGAIDGALGVREAPKESSAA